MASSSYDDLGDAVADLDALQQITGGMQTKALDQLNAAMLIDIAASLRIIAESASAPGAIIDEHGDEHEGQIPASIDDAPLEVGDRVAPLVEDDDDQLPDEVPAGVIESIGMSEGEEYATVIWDSGMVTRAWVSQLRRAVAVNDLVGWDAGNPLGDGTTTAPEPSEVGPAPADAFAALRKGKGKKKGKGND